MITAQQYQQRPRFETAFNETFEDFSRRLSITQDTVFEIYTLYGYITWARVTDQIDNLLYDIQQCEPNGEPLPRGITVGSCNKSEIAWLLYTGDWRVFSSPNSSFNA